MGLLRAVSDRIKGDESNNGRRAVYISALTGEGCEELARVIEAVIRQDKRRVTFFIPNAEAGALSRLYSEKASVESVDYGADGMTVTAVVDDRVYGLMRKYDVSPDRESREDWE